MKLSNHLVSIAFVLANVVGLTNAYAGPEITGIPREPKDKGKIEEARLSQQLCGPGWTLSNNRDHSKDSFLCVPVKPKVECPQDAQLFETDCSIGCLPRPK